MAEIYYAKTVPTTEKIIDCLYQKIGQMTKKVQRIVIGKGEEVISPEYPKRGALTSHLLQGPNKADVKMRVVHLVWVCPPTLTEILEVEEFFERVVSEEKLYKRLQLEN